MGEGRPLANAPACPFRESCPRRCPRGARPGLYDGMFFPALQTCRALCAGLSPNAPPREVLARPEVRAAFQERLDSFACASTGSTTRVERAILLDTPPSVEAQEITDKGSINQKTVLAKSCRAGRGSLSRTCSRARSHINEGAEMNSSSRIDVESLMAFDVHVHMEPTDDGIGGGRRRPKNILVKAAPRATLNALAEYYRSRKIAFVIFTVDERLTGRPHVSNEEVVRFAERNSDVAIPFASIDPNRGAEGVQEAKRLVVRGENTRIETSPADPAIFPKRSSRLPSVRSLRRGASCR